MKENYFLSIAEREVLIKGVVQVILFKLPKCFIFQIHKITAKLWWKQVMNKKKSIGEDGRT